MAFPTMSLSLETIADFELLGIFGGVSFAFLMMCCFLFLVDFFSGVLIVVSSS